MHLDADIREHLRREEHTLKIQVDNNNNKISKFFKEFYNFPFLQFTIFFFTIYNLFFTIYNFFFTIYFFTINNFFFLQFTISYLSFYILLHFLLLGQLTQKLSAIKRQADNVMTVYSPNMPRLLKRIDEEFRKGKFKAKPRGPVGSFIKLKDPNWIPAVENFLSGILSAFCVDNRSDANKLALIMREVFRDERCPQIISSKFYDKVSNLK